MESFCNLDFVWERISLMKLDLVLKFPDTQESFWTLWKVSGYPDKILDLKVSGYSGKFLDTGKFMDTLENFLDTLECFLNLLKVFGHTGKFLESVESLPTLWKVYGHSRKFPEQYAMFLDPHESPRELLSEKFLPIRVCYLESF